MSEAKPAGQQGSFHIPSLDGVRAVAVLMVVLAHAHLPIVSGTVAVNTFFFLSGFLITTLLRRETEKSGSVNIRNFYIRRVLRIVPAMYLVLTVALALSLAGVLHGKVDPLGTFLQYAHLSNYLEIFGKPDHVLLPATEIYWSLAVEEHFYLVFPFLFILFQKIKNPKSVVWAMSSVLVLVLAWRFVVAVFIGDSIWANRGSEARLDSILIGCMMAMFFSPFFEKEKVAKLGSGAMALTGFIVLILSNFYKQEWYWHTFRYTLQAVCLIPIFVYIIEKRDTWTFKVLNSKLLVWIGQISYGIYLIHYIVMSILKSSFAVPSGIVGGLLLSAATILITLPICDAMFRWYESPILRLRKKFSA